MKTYLILGIILILVCNTVSFIAGLLFAEKKSETGRYQFNSGSYNTVFDSSTGDLYVLENGVIQKTNYKEVYESRKIQGNKR